MSTENSSLIEHQNVPQEHRGLHDFLYSSSDEHGGAADTNVDIEHEAPQPLDAWCDEVQNAKIAAVYMVFDRDQQPQYIGVSRNVTLSLRSHLSQHGPEICAWVKVQAFKFPKREEMALLRDQWIAALPSLPPGNAEGNTAWAGTVKDAATQVMSETERQIYEEKKLKLRRAMADGTLHQEPSPAVLTAHHQDLEHDNWGAVISEQSQETQNPSLG